MHVVSPSSGAASSIPVSMCLTLHVWSQPQPSCIPLSVRQLNRMHCQICTHPLRRAYLHFRNRGGRSSENEPERGILTTDV